MPPLSLSISLSLRLLLPFRGFGEKREAVVDGGKDKPSHKMVRVLRRHCEFRRQSQVHNALSPTSSEESCTVNLTVPNRTREATAQLAKYVFKSTCELWAGQRFISSAWHIPQAKRQDRHQLSVSPSRPSVYLSARGVVPVRRDVVFVHHAWTIPDAPCDARGRGARPQVVLKKMSHKYASKCEKKEKAVSA